LSAKNCSLAFHPAVATLLPCLVHQGISNCRFLESVPSQQSPWRYLLRPSWATIPEDRSWEPEPRRHQPHRRSRGGC
jgi:hypothetical protein